MALLPPLPPRVGRLLGLFGLRAVPQI